ncbi:MAG: FkbM family methyltransferase [Solirubrobacteraceae bacterium]|nr:FkbM family methyltransferase [Solirubrobacteraceae bacterium]
MKTIVDLGANIGLTSVYLASHYGSECLVAVEPVPANAALARQNLALNGIAGEVIEGVVGPPEGTAYFHDAVHSNVGHLAHHGRAVKSFGIRSVFAHLGVDAVDLLKVDIEGAEDALLDGDRSWLDQVRALIIEIHTHTVDDLQIVRILESEGFHHIPSSSVYAHSATAFVRHDDHAG